MGACFSDPAGHVPGNEPKSRQTQPGNTFDIDWGALAASGADKDQALKLILLAQCCESRTRTLVPQEGGLTAEHGGPRDVVRQVVPRTRSEFAVPLRLPEEHAGILIAASRTASVCAAIHRQGTNLTCSDCPSSFHTARGTFHVPSGSNADYHESLDDPPLSPNRIAPELYQQTSSSTTHSSPRALLWGTASRASMGPPSTSALPSVPSTHQSPSPAVSSTSNVQQSCSGRPPDHPPQLSKPGSGRSVMQLTLSTVIDQPDTSESHTSKESLSEPLPTCPTLFPGTCASDLHTPAAQEEGPPSSLLAAIGTSTEHAAVLETAPSSQMPDTPPRATYPLASMSQAASAMAQYLTGQQPHLAATLAHARHSVQVPASHCVPIPIPPALFAAPHRTHSSEMNATGQTPLPSPPRMVVVRSSPSMSKVVSRSSSVLVPASSVHPGPALVAHQLGRSSTGGATSLGDVLSVQATSTLEPTTRQLSVVPLLQARLREQQQRVTAQINAQGSKLTSRLSGHSSGMPHSQGQVATPHSPIASPVAVHRWPLPTSLPPPEPASSINLRAALPRGGSYQSLQQLQQDSKAAPAAGWLLLSSQPADSEGMTPPASAMATAMSFTSMSSIHGLEEKLMHPDHARVSATGNVGSWPRPGQVPGSSMQVLTAHMVLQQQQFELEMMKRKVQYEAALLQQREQQLLEQQARMQQEVAAGRTPHLLTHPVLPGMKPVSARAAGGGSGAPGIPTDRPVTGPLASHMRVASGRQVVLVPFMLQMQELGRAEHAVAAGDLSHALRTPEKAPPGRAAGLDRP